MFFWFDQIALSNTSDQRPPSCWSDHSPQGGTTLGTWWSAKISDVPGGKLWWWWSVSIFARTIQFSPLDGCPILATMSPRPGKKFDQNEKRLQCPEMDFITDLIFSDNKCPLFTFSPMSSEIRIMSCCSVKLSRLNWECYRNLNSAFNYSNNRSLFQSITKYLEKYPLFHFVQLWAPLFVSFEWKPWKGYIIFNPIQISLYSRFIRVTWI